MTKQDIDKQQAKERAKEIAIKIVVAKASNMSANADAEHGKDMANFFTEVYHGIAKTLMDDLAE